jgi:hypothetical protein
MRSYYSIILTSFVALLLAAAPSRTATFTFQNTPPNQQEDMRLVLDVASLRLEKFLEITLPDTIWVAVVMTQAQFDSLAGGTLPEWGAGAAIPHRDLIILREPMMDRYPGTMANLLQHELAHIALYHRTRGKPFPRFLNEGFAAWFAGEWSFSNITTVAAAQITGSITPLRDIDDVNSFHQAQANLAYAQSYLVVYYIFEQYGELAFLDLLDEFARGSNMSEAFHATFGISFWRFEADYRRFLQENYTLFSILSDMGALWIILALVVIVGYVVIRRRRKNALDRWREQERYESTDFDWSGSDDEPWKDQDDSIRF